MKARADRPAFVLGEKRREQVYFLYPDEAVLSDVAGVACLRLTVGFDIVGRFDGIAVCDGDETSHVHELKIDGVSVWGEPKPAPAEGELLEPPRARYVHAGSLAHVYMRGAFSRVLLMLQKAEPIVVAKAAPDVG